MTRSWLLSSWLGVSVALVWHLNLLAFYWHCFGEPAVILCSDAIARVCVSILGLLQGNFLCPLGQRFTVAIYACAFTCACSFTVHSVQGILLSFSVFPLPPLAYYYYY